MNPIDGEPMLVAAAKSSVPGSRLPDLLERAQDHLHGQLDDYRRGYERAHEGDRYEAFFVEVSHWEELGDDIGLSRRERDAVARAHREQLLWASRDEGRREEVETALDLREVVVVGR
ncbi:hypothetical protein [Halorarius litoreus]|uniref:hypothetical protein n=1 Tax=Halorarius litoreus TaxID=2962676 RepID=UPI0020CBFCCE|nr:hypothetical protein [Halorarius litoreus]